MRKILVLILFLLSATLQSAVVQAKLSSRNRAAIKLYDEGINHYSAGRLNHAIDALYEALAKDPDFIEPYLVLGDIYNSQGNYSHEMEVLIEAYKLDSLFFPSTMFNIGVAAIKIGKYKEGLEWLESYKWKHGDKKNAEELKLWIERGRFAKDAVDKAYRIELIPAGESLNNDYDEYWPSVTADEQTLVVTVLLPRDEQLFLERNLPKSALYFQEDFYFSKKLENGEWGKRLPLYGNINTPGNEGAQSLSADGNMMFFTACGRSDGLGSCDIYFSRRYEGGWSTPVNLGMPLNSPYWESQPSFSADGKTLYFVSNRPGGRGGKDIWKAEIQYFRKDAVPVFGAPTNLGANINTSREESSPFIHHDNKTLYFSSDGLGGMGALDIFVSRKKEDGGWSQPVNLGYPINTQGDEMGFVVNARGNRAYFSSDGVNDEGNSKAIYYFDLPEPLRPEPVLYVKGRVFDIESGETLPADFELKDLASAELVVTAQGNSFTGEFLVCLPIGGRYAFRASHPGYMFYSGHFDLHKGHSLETPYVLDIGLQAVKAGVKMTLENIFFETDSYELRDESKIELEGLISFMKENPELKILIGGHTDNQGPAAYNQLLSENRAKSVFIYLTRGGVPQERLKYKGFGMNQPIDDNSSIEGRAKNRRTEITVL